MPWQWKRKKWQECEGGRKDVFWQGEKLKNDTRCGVVRKTRKSPCGFQKSRNAQSCRTWVRLSHVKCSNLEKKLLCDICILIVQVNIAPLWTTTAKDKKWETHRLVVICDVSFPVCLSYCEFGGHGHALPCSFEIRYCDLNGALLMVACTAGRDVPNNFVSN